MRKLDRVWFLRAVLMTAFVTGFAGLVYQVVWHRYMANIFGSEAKATALVLAVFLGGLAAGYGGFGILSRGRSPRQLMKLCGWVEVGIGLFGFFFPQIYNQVFSVYYSFSVDSTTLSLAIDLLVAVLLIGLPTFLMGGTLPLLTPALSRDLVESPRVHAWIYSINTAGAFLGCLISGFVLVPSLGLPLTSAIAAACNIIGGVVLIGLGTQLSLVPEKVVTTEKPSLSGFIPLNRALVLAFLAGFMSITLQTLCVRLMSLAVGTSEYTFSMVVSLFILTLAWGAAQVAEAKTKNLMRNQILLFVGLFFIYVTVPYWGWMAHQVRIMFSFSHYAFYAYYFILFLFFGSLLWLSVAALGRNMPLLFEAINTEFKSMGHSVGRIYFVNTIGCVAGALLGGFLLLYFFNMDKVFILLLALCLISIVVTGLNQWQPKSLTLVGVAALAILVLPEWDKADMAAGWFRNRVESEGSYNPNVTTSKTAPKVLAYWDDPTTSVAIAEYDESEAAKQTADNEPELRAPQKSLSVLVNGKSDSSTWGDLPTTILCGHYPALFKSGAIGRVGVVGLGTGVTTGTIGLHESVESVDVFEISEAVKKFAYHFDPYNHSVSTNPLIRIRIGDAYRNLMVEKQKYGIITSEPSNPWVLGIERLYTKEFLSASFAKLDETGVHAQWINGYDISPETFFIALSTFRKVFPEVHVFWIPKTPDILIIGSKSALDAKALAHAERIFKQPKIYNDIRRSGIKTFADILASEVFFPDFLTIPAAVHDLEYPVLAHLSGQDFFRKKRLDLEKMQEAPLVRPFVKSMEAKSLLAQWVAQQPERMTVLQQVVESVCGTKMVNLVPLRGQFGERCIRTLAAYVVTQRSPASAIESMYKLTHFQRVLSGGPFKGDMPIRDIVDHLNASIKYSSTWARPAADSLEKLAQPCLGGDTELHMICRSRLVKALVDINESQRAEGLVGPLFTSATVPDTVKSELQTLFLNAHMFRQQISDKSLASVSSNEGMNK